MRKLLFADSEVFENEDAMDMQNGPAYDLSALLAAWCGNVADTGIISGADPQAVLAGLVTTASISGTDVNVSVATGSVVYAIADTASASWKVATTRSPLATSTSISAIGNVRVAVVELVVTESTTNANRNFKREISGRVVIQSESTPKYKDVSLSVRVRSGTEVTAGTDAYLPAWSADGLPLAILTITDTTVTVRDVRRMVRPGLPGSTFKNPLRAYTDISKTGKFGSWGATGIERNYLGFGSQTAMDYCEITNISSSYPYPVGTYVRLESGYTPTANSFGSVYACRVHPKVNAVELVASNKAHDVDRNLSSLPIALPAPWPVTSTVSGSEVKYLFPEFYGTATARASMDVFGTNYKVRSKRPSITVSGVTSGSTTSVDFSSIVPPNTMTIELEVSLYFTLATAAPTSINLVAGVDSTEGRGETEVYTMKAGSGGVQQVVNFQGVRVSMLRSIGLQAQFFIDVTGVDTSPFDVTFVLNEVNEVLRQ